MRPRLYIAIPAYDAGKTLAGVLARFPPQIVEWAEKLLVVDDGSTDDTYEVAARLAEELPKIRVVRHPANRGYGAAAKTALGVCREEGADVVAWVHADGQYAPETLPRLLRPLVEDRADIVQGSRMLGGGALAGGMPLYKYVANRALSFLENLVFGLRLAEYHSGYMLYSRKALSTIPFDRLSEGFIFDQEMLIVGGAAGLRITQQPIPTRYAGEVSHLRVVPYGIAVLHMIWRYLCGDYRIARVRRA